MVKELIKKEKAQYFGLKEVAKELENYIDMKKYPLEIMGVLNINEDSFFSGSRIGEKEALSRVYQMIEEGADIIDFGGVSSRPGSEPVPEEEELERVKPVIDLLYQNSIHQKVTLSIDTFQPLVAKYALDNGFSIINDITGLENDQLCQICGEYKARVCIMHMQKNPQTMQQEPYYEDVTLEVKEFFQERVQKAKSYGIEDIILDVGIGFGKTLEHNTELINLQKDFLSLGYPLLIGASRKSMIDKIIPTPVEERLPGTLSIHIQSVLNGASIVRCHDVKEHVQVFKVLDFIRKGV